MSAAQVPFKKRIRRIVRDHQRLSNGSKHEVLPDGLIVLRPRVYNPKFPLRGLVLLVGAAILFKGFIYASLGSATYVERVAQLANGSIAERVGAWVMQPDVVTLAVGQFLTAIGL